MTVMRPLPDIDDPDYAPFWEACAQSRLVVQQCTDCRTLRWPPRPTCSICGGVALTWPEVGGTGRLYSWTVVGRAYVDAFAEVVPYAVGVIELDDGSGLRFLGTVLHDEPLVVGRSCVVEFASLGTGIALPVWRAQ